MQSRSLLITMMVSLSTALSSATLPGACQDPVANSMAVPTQILKTGINLTEQSVSPNGVQVAEIIGIVPALNKVHDLRGRVSQIKGAPPTLENLALRQDFTDAQMETRQMIEQSNLEVDYVLAEINAERNLYGEVLSSLTSRRDRLVARSNAASYYTNGVLWAVGEGFDIPTYRVPKYSIPSGTISILAGVVPSFFSLWAMHQYNGKKLNSEDDPNMLAKLFDYPINKEVDYPSSVLAFLNSVPPGGTSKKSRKVQLIDRWIADDNIHSFTDRKSKSQLDAITAGASQAKGLSIEVLGARQDMLEQLASELLKMKRMLLELSLAAKGDKTL
jgi:hypothetical protein